MRKMIITIIVLLAGLSLLALGLTLNQISDISTLYYEMNGGF